MKLQRIFILCLCVLCTLQVKAQVGDAIRKVFKGTSDSVMVADSAQLAEEVTNEDSLQVIQLQQQLEESKLSEANLRMEFEQFKLNVLASDSIKRANNVN